MYTNIFSFGEQIVLHFDTRDAGLPDSIEQPIKLRYCVFNKVFLANHLSNNLNCG